MANQSPLKPKRITKTWQDVLVLQSMEQGRSKTRRYYHQWRTEQQLPERCDNPECCFHTNPLIWNSKPLKPILDHKNGNRFDNRPGNLRFLCPNCDSQQVETRGGANRGRVIEVIEGGASLRERDGTTSISRSGVSY
jgi:hypothetical protein